MFELPQAWLRGRPERLAALLGDMAFFNLAFLFPLSQLYYYYVDRGVIPPFPGYPQRVIPVLVCLAMLALWGFSLCSRGGKASVRQVFRHRSFHVFLGMGVCWLLVIGTIIWRNAYVENPVDVTNTDVRWFNLKVGVQYFIFLVTGLFFPLDFKRYRWWGLGLWCVLTINIILNTRLATFTLTLGCGDSGGGAYHFVSDSYAIWSLFVTASFAGRRWLLWGGNIVSLAVMLAAKSVAGVGAFLVPVFGLFLLPRLPFWLSLGVLLSSAAILLPLIPGNPLSGPLMRLLPSDGQSSDTGMFAAGKFGVFRGNAVVRRVLRDGQDVASIQCGDGAIASYGFHKGYDRTRDRLRITHALEGDYSVLVRCLTNRGYNYLFYRTAKAMPSPTVVKSDCYYVKYGVGKPPPGDKPQTLERDLRSDLERAGLGIKFVHADVVLFCGSGIVMGIERPDDARTASGWRLMDDSLFSRYYFMKEQMPLLMRHWFWGDYAGQLREYRHIGYYIHNYLSFWSQFGLIPFLLFVGLYLWQYVLVCREYFKVLRRDWGAEKLGRRVGLGFGDPGVLLVFLVATFNLVEIVFARSYATPYVWLSLGMMATYLAARQRLAAPQEQGIH